MSVCVCVCNIPEYSAPNKTCPQEKLNLTVPNLLRFSSGEEKQPIPGLSSQPVSLGGVEKKKKT